MKILICIAKICQKILNILGRGSAFPGKILLKLNPDILKEFIVPQKVICVTGTAGKTSISAMITQIYKKSGYKVANNYKGSNLESGIISTFVENSDMSGKIQADILVLEVDERYIKKVFKYITPTYLIINNISRDQLARNGHFDIVLEDIKKGISNKTNLILNADDPLVVKLGLEHKGNIVYYGLKKTEYSINKSKSVLDLTYCPICNEKLIFDYFQYGNMGYYHCINNDFNRPEVLIETEQIDETTIKINNNIIKLNNIALYNIYNVSAAYITAITDNIDENIVTETLTNISLKIKRYEKFKIENKTVTLLLSKNDTPISYNQSLEYVNKIKSQKSIILGFDAVSLRYNIKDISWLYNINFNDLNNDSVKEIICMGKFAYDIATRLKYADIRNQKIKIDEKSNNILSLIKSAETEEIYLLVPFDIEKQFKKSLQRI